MKCIFQKVYLSFTFILFFIPNLYAVATFTSGSTAAELASRIQGNGITITNPTITHGSSTQVGVYSNGIDGANLEIDEGIILTGSTVAESFTTNDKTNVSLRPSGTYRDADLLAIDPSAIYNPVIFEFDVTLDDNTRLLLIDYQFASDEYNEYVGSRFNDSFGFFISGGDLNQTYNIARVIDNQTYVTIENITDYLPVTVNNVNNGKAGSQADGTTWDATNSAFFIDNDKQNGTAPIIVEYDGLTHILHATLDNLTPGTTYHFKMAIADTGDANWDTGVFVNKISGLREPSICYDYAYQQNGNYLTEGYDPTKGPFINANVEPNNSGLPVNVSMYFKNTRESEIVASHIFLDILDINTSQANYKFETTYVTETNSLVTTKIDDVDLNVSNSYIKDIPITSFDSLDYFYAYFSLDPIVDKINLPIIARITYDLTIPLSETDSITIKRSSLIDSEVPICGGGVSTFDPDYGLFNVIENSLYVNDTTYAYNLNTQVTNRRADLSLVAIDANETTNPDLHALKSITTVVAIDMLDLSAFHITAASCSEAGNSITDKTWVIMTDQSIVPLDSNMADFYATARQNVAFRIAYNTNDETGEIVTLEDITQGGETRYNVLNFSDAVKTGECATDIANGTDTVAQWCSNAGTSFSSAMTNDALRTCMECIYGKSTKLLCSRDNFAIRPEAFLMNINDQSQTNAILPKSPLTNDFSGVVTPTNIPINLAAGYNYNLEVNATDHLGNTPSTGYNREFTTNSGTSAKYLWTPATPANPNFIITQCNDTTDHNFTAVMSNGVADVNTSLEEVGEYTLQLSDTSWTTVDSIQQSHHAKANFIPGPDCVLNSTATATTSNPDSGNGCNISSNHTNTETGFIYNDLNVNFHPYKYAITNTITLGASAIPPLPIKPFVYMADIDQDEAVSVHLNTIVAPTGYNGTPLSNYVDGCFAKPLNISISKTDTNNTTLTYKVHHHDINASNVVVAGLDMNQSIAAANVNQPIRITLPTTYFQKDENGTTTMRTDMNYNRLKNIAVNPEDVNYTAYKVDDNLTLMNADLINNKFAETNSSLGNQRVLHYYGRVTVPEITVICNTNNNCRTGLHASSDTSIKELSTFVIYCNNATGIVCSNNPATGILPDDSTRVTDIRWWANRNHDRSATTFLIQESDGAIGMVSETAATGRLTEISRAMTIPNFESEIVIQYNGILPYDSLMEMNSSNWLIYNDTNPAATANDFLIEWRGDGGWSGKHEDNTTTQTNSAQKTNRRVMW